ncbi:MAG TPA: VCBS repeat-containing protein, partial [Fodinibius sp.]|nr:VCBS repeat-containing protein [Fodinibius sp.]
DVLYINNRDGTFSDRSKGFLKHTSYAGMGLDIADFNNDGWPDVMQADMMPADYQERKLMSYGVSYERYANKIAQGYNYSYTKNTLQMNNGLDSNEGVMFSEIGRMAGVAYTGWSWASLFGDYNNDGNKDIMITNGYPKATNDFDYMIANTPVLEINKQARIGNISAIKNFMR